MHAGNVDWQQTIVQTSISKTDSVHDEIELFTHMSALLYSFCRVIELREKNAIWWWAELVGLCLSQTETLPTVIPYLDLQRLYRCTVRALDTLITSAKKDMFSSLFVCLPVCLFVSNFAQKPPNGFA